MTHYIIRRSFRALSGVSLLLILQAGGAVPAAIQPGNVQIVDGAAQPGDEALTCSQLNAEVDRLMIVLGGQAERLTKTLAALQQAQAGGSQRVADAVRQTQARQAISAAVSGAGDFIPGARLMSGLIGSAAGAAVAPGADPQRMMADQQVALREMNVHMETLARQSSESAPGAMRLQRINQLQAVKGC